MPSRKAWKDAFWERYVNYFRDEENVGRDGQKREASILVSIQTSSCPQTLRLKKIQTQSCGMLCALYSKQLSLTIAAVNAKIVEIRYKLHIRRNYEI
jgi:hypothetical protein